MGDAVTCAKAGQKTADGYHNLERMLKAVGRRGEVLLCGTCMDARGMTAEEVAEGARRSSMDELTERWWFRTSWVLTVPTANARRDRPAPQTRRPCASLRSR